MTRRVCAICYTCGKRVEYSECKEECPPPEDARCKVLAGWITITWWKGMKQIEGYDFCSLICLQNWLEKQLPKVPEVFLKAFEEKAEK